METFWQTNEAIRQAKSSICIASYDFDPQLRLIMEGMQQQSSPNLIHSQCGTEEQKQNNLLEDRDLAPQATTVCCTLTKAICLLFFRIPLLLYSALAFFLWLHIFFLSNVISSIPLLYLDLPVSISVSTGNPIVL